MGSSNRVWESLRSQCQASGTRSLTEVVPLRPWKGRVLTARRGQRSNDLQGGLRVEKHATSRITHVASAAFVIIAIARVPDIAVLFCTLCTRLTRKTHSKWLFDKFANLYTFGPTPRQSLPISLAFSLNTDWTRCSRHAFSLPATV